jgi:hypothetical protein
MDGKPIENKALVSVFTEAVANAAAGKPSIEIDVVEFLHFLDGLDAPEAEKIRLLEVLVETMIPFVDMGFGLHPVQQACGQVAQEQGEPAQADSEVLDSMHSGKEIE